MRFLNRGLVLTLIALSKHINFLILTSAVEYSNWPRNFGGPWNERNKDI